MKKICKILGLLLVMILVLNNVSSDTLANEDEKAAGVTLSMMLETKDYSAILYNNINGLPTSEANAITQTKEGFIWIGSYSGLIRYDGRTFERIDSTTGISSVVSLYADSKNRLWVGTNDNGVAVIDRNSVQQFTKKNGLKSSSVRAIVEDHNGKIYVATTHGLATINEDYEVELVDEPQINEEYIKDIVMGNDGIIYGITFKGDVFTIKDGKLTGYYDGKKLGIEDIHSILPDEKKSGFVYIGTKHSKVYYGNLANGFVSSKKYDTGELNYINCMRMYDGNLWVSSDNGIGILVDGKINIIENVPMNNSIDYIMRDYQNNMWFVSTRQGVMKIVPNQFKDVFEMYDLPSGVVNTTCTLGERVFVGKDDGLIVFDDNGVVDSIPISSARENTGEFFECDDLITLLKVSRIRSIVRDSKDRLWFSTFGDNGIIRYDNGEVVRFTTGSGLPSNRIRTVCERWDGNIMVACTGGVAIISGDEVVEVFDEDSGISNIEVLTVAENKKDIIVGTDGDGLYIINGTKTVHLGTESGLDSEVIMRVKKDNKRDIFWIVTSNSLAYMDKNYNITTVNKFPYSNNFDIYENSKDEMWILSSNGIYISPVEDLLANGEINPVYYGKDMGLGCITTSNSYSALEPDGTLYIAGSTGVVKVNIEKPFEDVSTIKMAVPYLDIDGKRIYPDSDETFVIPYDVKKLTIYGYVYTFSLVNPQITYYLEGFDKEKTTVRCNELGSLDYTNLPGGKYYFVMQLRDEQGNGYKDLKILIEKKKAFYETIWFKVLCIFLLGLIFLSITLIYIERKIRAFRKKEQENKLLVREIVEAFAKTIDMKDKYTNGHSSRVAEYTAMLTRELGYDEETVEKYYNIALLHDIGKIGVPAAVLNKSGKLTDEEFNIIKSHSMLGYNVLKDISIMPELSVGAGSHHERPDGKGYPRGLKDENIPRVAQIIAVADTFDAMYSDRPYRKRMNFDKVVSIMKEVSGSQLKDDVVEAFLRLVEKGEFRDPSDDGGGTFEDIDNIHKKYEKE